MQSPKKYNTPIYNYLRKYATQDINIFHMPGHKLSRGIPQELSRDVLQLDVTEIEGTDNLHCPEGIIMEAQELAAKAFGADRTFFLVNGSTCGIQAAVMSVCARGQKIIIGRDSHKSVVSALILSGAEPVFVYPDYNEQFEISEAISAKSIETALRESPDAAAVLITRPNYYGICADIEEISRIVHSYNKILIVDEAHGAHLAFSPLLPAPALLHGADICIQSAHKTLPAVTQSAYLHIKGTRVDSEKLKFNLTMLQTSSPSYIILSYLDIARELMMTEGAEKLGQLIKNIDTFSRDIEEGGIYQVLSNQNLRSNILHDTTRLVINISNLGISGYSSEKILRDKFKTQVEMADNRNLVFITTVADTGECFERLTEAMRGLVKLDKHYYKETPVFKSTFIKNPERRVSLYEAYAAQKEQIPFSEANGRICAGIITPYPPGIPVIYPGEVIDERIIRYVDNIIASGGKVNGLEADRNVVVVKKQLAD